MKSSKKRQWSFFGSTKQLLWLSGDTKWTNPCRLVTFSLLISLPMQVCVDDTFHIFSHHTSCHGNPSPTFSLWSCICCSRNPLVRKGPSSPSLLFASPSTSTSHSTSNWRKWVMPSKRCSCFFTREPRRAWRSNEVGLPRVREACTADCRSNTSWMAPWGWWGTSVSSCLVYCNHTAHSKLVISL